MQKRVTQAIVSAVVDKVASAVSSAAGKQQKHTTKKKTSRRRSRRQATGNSGSRTAIVRATPSQGTMLRSSAFRIGGLPQAHADYDNSDGIRVHGTCLFQSIVQSNGSTAAGFNGVYYKKITPSISERAFAFALSYGFYSFRYLRVNFVPSVSTNNAGNVTFALVNNWNQVTNMANTDWSLLENEASVRTPVWQHASIACDCTGTKLWSTNSTALDADKYQFALFCRLSNMATMVEQGTFIMEYVLDFYAPTTHSSVSLLLKTERDQDDPPVPSETHEVDSHSGGTSHDPSGGTGSSSSSSNTPDPMLESAVRRAIFRYKANPSPAP